MQKKFLNENFKYDGTQLKPLFAYMNYNMMGDSIVSWVGPCDISFDHMVDGEDVLAKAEIRGELMLHFIVEVFDQTLMSGVCLQRLFASQMKDLIEKLSGKKFSRSGDDLYFEDQKLSISIASRGANSVMIHFAMNVVNRGTPVKTCALMDFGLDPVFVAEKSMEAFVNEYQSIREATWKVKTL